MNTAFSPALLEIVFCWFCISCSALTNAGEFDADNSAKPNIVLMLADDLGWGAVSYHQQWCETPNVDSIARRGIELDRFYVAPMCSPTRAGLMTGRYPIRFGLARAVIPPQRNFGLPVSELTLADALGKVGYTNRGIFGKWHLGHHNIKWHPLRRGFTEFEGHYNGAIDYFSLERDGERDWHIGLKPSDKSGYSTDLIANAASEFILRSAKEEAPYFCYVPFNAPHSPFQAKDEDLARYKKVGNNKKPKVEKQNQNKSTLRAMVSCMDQAVGKILNAIQESGEADNTQVWFISDNGGVGKFRENNVPLRGSKLTTFEGGIRVVACVRWPAKWKGQRKLENTMGYIDVLPTMLQSAGADVGQLTQQHKLDGVSLCGLLEGNNVDETKDNFPERDWYSYHGQSSAEKETIAIKTAKWKLIVNGPDIRRGPITENHEVHLFKMPNDLLEKQNIADQNPEVVNKLFAKLKTHRQLQPKNCVSLFREGKQNFTPWKNWDIKTRQ